MRNLMKRSGSRYRGNSMIFHSEGFPGDKNSERTNEQRLRTTKTEKGGVVKDGNKKKKEKKRPNLVKGGETTLRKGERPLSGALEEKERELRKGKNQVGEKKEESGREKTGRKRVQRGTHSSDINK